MPRDTKRQIPAAGIRATDEGLGLIRQQVPSELIRLARWIAWDGTRLQNGRLSKTPLNPSTSGKAMTNRSSTWGTFEQAVAFALRDHRVGGVGIVLTNSDYWALDLDHVIDPTAGEIAPAARKFLASITPSYLERSPSGDGLHVIYRGGRPTMLSATRAKDAFGQGTQLEVFGGNSSRYLTMTGLVWEAG